MWFLYIFEFMCFLSFSYFKHFGTMNLCTFEFFRLSDDPFCIFAFSGCSAIHFCIFCMLSIWDDSFWYLLYFRCSDDPFSYLLYFKRLGQSVFVFVLYVFDVRTIHFYVFCILRIWDDPSRYFRRLGRFLFCIPTFVARGGARGGARSAPTCKTPIKTAPLF